MSPRHRRLQMTDFDPDAVLAAIAGITMEQRVLMPGRLSIDYHHLDLDDVTLDTGFNSLSWLAMGAMARDHVTIGCVMDQRQPAQINGVTIGHQDLQLYAPGSELLYRTTGPARWMAIQTGAEVLRTHAGARGFGDLDLSPVGMRNIPAVPGRTNPVVETANRILAAGIAGELEMAELRCWWREQLLDAIVGEIVERGTGRPSHDRTEIARRTLARLAGCLDESLDITATARAVGLSPRMLQHHFRQALGLSPRTWLRIERLTQARRDLLGGVGRRLGVTGVAMRRGYSHLGRFAGEYRALFGESPRATAQRVAQA